MFARSLSGGAAWTLAAYPDHLWQDLPGKERGCEGLVRLRERIKARNSQMFAFSGQFDGDVKRTGDSPAQRLFNEANACVGIFHATTFVLGTSAM